MKYIFLMAGQGAQYPGMGRDLYQELSEVQELFAIANKQLSFDLRALLFEGSAEDLQATDKTQIAITVVNLAAAMALASHNITPSWLAGFSLGEYSAMVLAGVLTVPDACTAVKVRGACMEEASRALDSTEGTPGMLAIIGISLAEVRAALLSARISEAYIAIHNSPTQTVVGGTAEGLKQVQEACDNAGALRIVRLRVSGPFHTPLIEEARRNFQKEIRSIKFSDPRLPIYSNVTGAELTSGEALRRYSVQQLVSPLLWTEEERAVVAASSHTTRTALDVGPGNVLCGLWKAYARHYRDTDRDIPACVSTGTLQEIQALAESHK